MKRIIIIRFGEIFLKGNNRGYFEKTLFSNIAKSLRRFECILQKISGRYVVSDYSADIEEKIIDQLKKVFGIHSISIALETVSDFDAICSASVSLFEERLNTMSKMVFKVETNRADKGFPMKSPEISSKIGELLLSKFSNLSVNIHNPQVVLNIDIREGGKTLIFTDVIKCERGMPYGTGGRGLLMLSGGIDSPVAGYMMGKRGMNVTGLHFHSYPYTSQLAREKVEELASVMKEYFNNEITLYVVPVTEIQEEIHKKCDERFMITILRRFMFRIADRIAKMHSYDAIITGESLGQVASQTVESITVTNSVVRNVPVLRPLIAIDKIDIIETSKKIGTYDISIQPYEDCCTIFLPKNPIIKPNISETVELEQKLDVELLIGNALKAMEMVKK